MSEFLERHGTVLLLYSLVLMGLSATITIGLKAHVDPEKLFAWVAGFTMGAFSGLMIAMKVNNGNGSQPPTTKVAGGSVSS